MARRLLGFAVLPVVGGLAPLVAIPAIAAHFGATGWRDVALGQSIGAAAAVVVELGWGISGPQRSARQSPANLRRSVALALTTQLVVLVPVTAGVWAVAHLVTTSSPALVAWIGTAAALGSVNVVWCWIGLGRPGAILWADTAPRTLPVVAAALALAAGAPLWVYPLALVVSGLVPVVLGSAVLGIGPATVRTLTPRLVVRAIRIQLQPLLGRVLSATYISVPITLAGVTAPGAVAVFAAADRLQRWVLTGLKALPTALQGWVGSPATPDARIHRAWLALWGNAAVGLGVAAGFVVLVPVVSRAFFAGVADVATDLAVLSGLLIVVVTTSRATGGLVLVALRGVPAITLSAAAGCVVGVPGVLVLAGLDGARGALAGVLAAESAVLAVQVGAIVVLRRRRRAAAPSREIAVVAASRGPRTAPTAISGEGGALRVAHIRVEDPGYPRNARVREHLRDAGFSVTVHLRQRGGPPVRRLLRDVAMILRLGRYDVYLVAEFSLVFAPLVALVARLHHGVVVVDRFTGQYETAIDDHGLGRPWSLRALRCRLVDLAAERSADVLLIDTAVRAAALRRRVPTRTAVLSLPVGAPAWAVPGPMPVPVPFAAVEVGAEPGVGARAGAGAAAATEAEVRDGLREVPAGVGPSLPASPTLPVHPALGAASPLRVLFYGHDVPLHGLPVIITALGMLEVPVRATFVSFPSVLDKVQAQVDAEGARVDCTLLEPLPGERLARVIAGHDVVLGVFGTSDKARSVIPNKVWQGLAAGKTVVTGTSPALAELRPLVGAQLVEVPAGDPAALAAALGSLAAARRACGPDMADAVLPAAEGGCVGGRTAVEGGCVGGGTAVEGAGDARASTAARLEAYTEEEHARFAALLRARCERGGRRGAR